MEFNNNKGEYLFPYRIKRVDPATNKDLLQNFTGNGRLGTHRLSGSMNYRHIRVLGEKTGFVQVGEEGWFFPSKYEEAAEHFYNFASRPDDIWVATFPRSGTTWTQELVWMIANNLDYAAAQATPLTHRFPFFE